MHSLPKRGSIWLGLGTKIHPVAREGQLHAGATPPRGDVYELFAAKMAPDMDVDMESRDDVVLETSPECVGATGEALYLSTSPPCRQRVQTVPPVAFRFLTGP